MAITQEDLVLSVIDTVPGDSHLLFLSQRSFLHVLKETKVKTML